MKGYIIGRRVKLIFYFAINYIGGWAMKNLSNECGAQFECLKKGKASRNKNLNPDVLQSYKNLMIFFICLTLIITNFSLAVTANRILGTPIEEPGEKRAVNEGDSSGGREVKSNKGDLDSDIESTTSIGSIEDDDSKDSKEFKDSKDATSTIDSVKNTLLNVLGRGSSYTSDDRPAMLYEWVFQEEFIRGGGIGGSGDARQEMNPVFQVAVFAKNAEYMSRNFDAGRHLFRIGESGIQRGGELALKMQEDGTWENVYRAFNHWYPKSYNEIRKVLAEFEKEADALRLSPPTNLRAIEVTETSVRLRWTPPSNTSNVSEYWVILNGQQRFRYNGTIGTISELKPDTEYSFYAYSVDSNENLSQRSNRITVRTKKLEPPTNLKATQITDTTISLTWFPSRSANVTGYQVWYRKQGVGNYNRAGTVDERVFILKNLDPLTTYEIYVRAIVNSDIRSDRSNLLPVTTDKKEIPLAPTNLKATEITDTTANLSWTPSKSDAVTGYQVWYREEGAEKYSRATTLNDTSYRLEGLNSSDGYEIYVRAVDENGNRSNRSNVIKIVLAENTPGSKTVTFSNPEVESIVRRQLGKTDDDIITEADLLEITEIDLWFTNDLSDLANMPNLNSLYVELLGVDDISPLADLANLERLWLSDNNITDISPLANLTNLRLLTMSANNIKDVSPLSNLANLESLELDGNNITDLSPLANLTKLETLWLSENNITDISALSNLINLDMLRLWNNNITDISALSNLINLRELGLGHNNITDISALSNLTNALDDVRLDNNLIEDISPLGNLRDVRWLYLENNKITDISPLANLTILRRLDLEGNEITDISPINDLDMRRDGRKLRWG